jgi:hypothetical protein
MRNGAYSLALLSALGGLLLLMGAAPADFRTTLGSTLLLTALLLGGIGKAIDVLDDVKDGAKRPDNGR